MKALEFLKCSFALTTLYLFSLTGSAQNQIKPNIIFIMADDMRPEIKSYGIDRAATPNLDRLATKGVLFTRAYCQQAVCAASRASMLIGMRPDAAGVDYPYSQYYVNTLLAEYPTLFSTFSKNGYHLETMGKLHHGYVESVQVNHRDFRTDEYYDPNNQAIYDNPIHETRREKIAELLPYELADLPDSLYDDSRMGDAAVEFIKNYKNRGNDKPYFLGVGFWKPHAPYVAPAKYAEPFTLEDIELSVSKDHMPDVELALPYVSTLPRYKMEDGVPGRKGNQGYDCSDQRAKEIIQAYLACTNFIDAQIGKIIDALSQTDQLNNTIIIFASDHGYHLGDHTHWGKTTNFECSAKTPLIVVDPRIRQKGVKCNALVELVDIYPSLIDMAGFDVPDFIEGTSFKQLINNPEKDWKTAAFTQFPRGGNAEGYSIRTNSFRYTEWREKNGTEVGELIAAELYDHVNDSLEIHNLAESYEFESVREELQTMLKLGWKGALPDRFENNSNNKVAPFPIAWDHK
jgi:iduronate 2-sulfatase